ncbi:glycoside hydrolase family 28 protein [Consotaella salsifontis]|uniref:Polygalacturonase n=1 Tax=Consotaella salsifontis TaxID=1365950 RepID=A0A1T4RAP9_9HYPH|nr:glycoside hydrolase family 28 protein [Consotaella salsifontis]SKA12758.1 Polygalacturonase [Consotaella salsifontis]
MSTHTVLVPAELGDRTEVIQAALDSGPRPCRVVLLPGRHLCGGLKLPSRTELHLSQGAELEFLSTYDAFAENTVGVIAEDSDRAMIVATDADEIAITGEGSILAGGDHYSEGDDADMGTRLPFAERPRVIVFEDCRDVRLEDFGVGRSPMWTLHLVNCEAVALRGIRVDNDRRMPNTDGIVIDGCRDVVIADCDIATADDGIVLKTSHRMEGTTASCQRITVRDCRIESLSCALKIGTETFGDVCDITFENCQIVRSNRALGIFSRDGGAIRRVRFSSIAVDCRETAAGYWGSGEALTINRLDRRPGDLPAGDISDVVVEDVSGCMQGALNLYSDPPGHITNVVLRRIALVQAAGPLGTALEVDLRPGPADLQGEVADTGRKNAWRKDADGRLIGLEPYPGGMPGLFARGVSELVVEDVEIVRPDPLPKGWNVDSAMLVDCLERLCAGAGTGSRGASRAGGGSDCLLPTTGLIDFQRGEEQ